MLVQEANPLPLIVPQILVHCGRNLNKCKIFGMVCIALYIHTNHNISYLQAKNIRRQFKQIWRKDKSAQNRTILQKQIAWCNSLIVRDKFNYHRNLISGNAYDSKKLWQGLWSVLQSIPEKVLPSHESQIDLANHFVTFFSDKISTIRDSFSSTDSFHSSFAPPPPPPFT